MNNGEQATADPSDRQEASFTIELTVIWNFDTKRIAEDFACEVEGDPVLAPVGLGLVVVPLEVHR